MKYITTLYRTSLDSFTNDLNDLKKQGWVVDRKSITEECKRYGFIYKANLSKEEQNNLQITKT